MLSQSSLLYVGRDPGHEALAALRAARYAVWPATTGAAALHLASEQAFDLLVLVLPLPRREGGKLLRQLRQAHPTPLPALVFTDTPPGDDLRAEAEACLPAPVAPEALLALVKALLRASRAERAQTQETARHHQLFAKMEEGFALGEVIENAAGEVVDLRLLEANQALRDIVGILPEGADGRRVKEWLPSLPATWLERVARVAQSGQPEGLRGIAQETGRHYEGHLFRPAPGQFAAIFTDVTARARATEELRRSEARLRLAQEAAGVGAWEWEKSPGQGFWSKEVRSLYGLPRDCEASYEAWVDSVHPEDRERVEAEVRLAVRAKAELNVEWRRRDGRWLFTRGRPVPTSDSQPPRYLGIVMDITERKQAEQALLRYQLLQEGARDIILLLDSDGRILDANEAAVLSYGYTREELLALNVAALRAPQEREEVARQLQTATKDGIGFEALHRRKDGAAFPVEVSARGCDVEGRPLLLSIIRDLTERRRAEEALRESEARYRSLFSGMREGFALHEVIYDAHGGPDDFRYLDVNPGFERLTGLTRAAAVGRTYREIGPRDEDDTFPTIAAVALTGEPTSVERYSAALDRHFAISAYRPAPHQVAVVFSDITERRRAQGALRESEERYRSLFRGMTEGFALHEVIHDAQGRPCDYRYLEVNPAFERLTGLSRGKAVGRTIREVGHAEGSSIPTALAAVAVTGEPARFEHHSPTLDRYFAVFAYCCAPGQVAAVFLDVSERRRAEAARELAHQRLNLHVDNSPLAVVEWDRDFRFTRWAGEAPNVFGWTAGEVLGRRIDELPWVREQDRPSLEAVMSDIVAGRGPDRVNRNRNLRKDGTVIHCEWYNTAIRDSSGALISVLSQVLDVTERMAAEARAVAAERARAEVAEQMTAEINHRMKNNLMLLSGVLGMQALRHPADGPIATALNEAVTRVSALSVVHEHLYPGQSGRVALQDLVRRIAEVAVQALRVSDVALSVEGKAVYVSSKLGSTLAILANELITNAIKHGAPAGDGKLHLEVRLRHRGGRLVLSVWNSGNPVPAGFDPGRQVGMGLQLTEGVVTGQLRGELRFVPTRGGTRAEIVLEDDLLERAGFEVIPVV